MSKNTSSEIGVFEAKTQLSQILERVEKGETIVITRHGSPVARLVPYEEFVDRQRARDAVRGLLEFRGPKLPKGFTLAELIARGRR